MKYNTMNLQNKTALHKLKQIDWLIAVRCESDAEFESWYYQNKIIIDQSFDLLIKWCENNPSCTIDIYNSSIDKYSSLGVIETDFRYAENCNDFLHFRFDSDSKSLVWNMFNGVAATNSKIQFQGKSIHGIDVYYSDVEILLGDDTSVNIRDRYHSINGAHSNFNGVDQYYIYGIKIDTIEEYNSIVSTEKSLSQWITWQLLLGNNIRR